jgi:thioredoxin-like negative regulator of GroEL
MAAGDYERAAQYLETAARADPAHRGVLKSLGYSYLWAGQVEKAASWLAQLPETEVEVRNYVQWWYLLRRPELIAYAQEYLAVIEGE